MSDSPYFVVYKASAGSGKTYTLVLEYLRLALQKDLPYPHILAVTFTNKATREMKMRILAALYSLAQQPDNPAMEGYRKSLTSHLKITEVELQERSIELLHELLHHYDRFFVETMDSFFQRLLRNLTRELGINSFYNITLNTDELLEKAIDRTLDEALIDEDLMMWIRQYTDNLLDNNKHRDFSRPLLEFSKNLLKEEYQAIENNFTDRLDKSKINEYKQKLLEEEKKIKQDLSDFHQQYQTIKQDKGFSPENFAYGLSGVIGFFEKKLNSNDPADLLENLGKRVLNAAQDTAQWFSQKQGDFPPFYEEVDSQLRPLLIKIISYLKANSPRWNTIKLKLKNLDNLGLIRHISGAMDEIKKEEYRFLLSDTVYLLDSMVGEDDISFVYEKIGTQFRHIMIDEFQDTSKLSWNNFRKLIKENVASGNLNVIVGDIKQSIYRWRNGEWRILKEIDKKGLHPNNEGNILPTMRHLNTNFRTGEAIVCFNNQLFTDGLSIVDQKVLSSLQNDSDKDSDKNSLAEIYADVRQEPHKKGGYVRLFFQKKQKRTSSTKTASLPKETILEDMFTQIEKLKSIGEPANSIAILIRKNNELDLLTRFFSDKRPEQWENETDKEYFTLVSDEAFVLGNSTALRMIIAALQYIVNPKDSLALGTLILLYQSLLLNGEIDNQEDLYPRLAAQIQAIRTSSASSYTLSSSLLPKDFIEQIETLRFLPLMETIETITKTFRLERFSSQSGYLYSFYDQVLDFTKSHASSINSFLQYWEEELCLKKAPLNEQVHGIQVHTIHKSKGMEFKHVFIPFCDWEFQDTLHQETLWLEDQDENAISPILPIPCGAKLKESTFKAAYTQEMFQQTIDNLNLLYVAFTRPKNSLFISATLSEKAISEGECKTVGEWVYQTIRNFPETEKSQIIPENDAIEWEFGEQSTKKTKAETPKSNNPFDLSVENHSYAFTIEGGNIVYSQTADAHDFLSSLKSPKPKTLQEQSERHKGIVFHELLSHIRHAQDLENTLTTALSDGLITSQDIDFCRRTLQQMLSLPEAGEWYSEKHRIFTETDFITKENGRIKTRRPDRIIDMGDQCIVLDYKFSEETDLQYKYERQVRNYVQILTEMGYKNVKGILWYVDLSHSEIAQKLIYC